MGRSLLSFCVAFALILVIASAVDPVPQDQQHPAAHSQEHLKQDDHQQHNHDANQHDHDHPKQDDHQQQTHEAPPHPAETQQNAIHQHSTPDTNLQPHQNATQPQPQQSQSNPQQQQQTHLNEQFKRSDSQSQQEPDPQQPAISSITPADATGHDWLFSGNASTADGAKRSVSGLESAVKMFSTERACGFAIQTERGLVYPWMATIVCNRVQCTGTLVSNNLVLASAACILACGTDAVRIHVGDPRLSGCGQGPLELAATVAVVHPKFSASQVAEFDIGLVQLSSVIDFNLSPFIYPICLVGVETADPNIECQVVAGHGHGQPLNIQNSVVNCFQPGNQVCQTNGLTGTTACVRQNQCFSSSGVSSPVICRRLNKSPTRYYLWGVTTSDHAPNTCSSGVARVSDCFSFIAQGLGFK